ncbi:MAG: hypothetical protein F6J93_05350 [Oscillatoria sp. SIO1A7]|nr:hypothetical protein [Oscillatoria sp. SIO1A7]
MPILPQPPYFLVIASLLIGVTSGLAFKGTLEQLVRDWSRDRSIDLKAKQNSKELTIPFITMSGGICVFLSSGLQIFTFPPDIAYIISVPLTIGTSALVWWQLGELLEKLAKEGFKALSLDAF